MKPGDLIRWGIHNEGLCLVIAINVTQIWYIGRDMKIVTYPRNVDGKYRFDADGYRMRYFVPDIIK